MKRLLILSLAIGILSEFCIGQNSINIQKSEKNNVPQMAIKVEKKYDKNGSLIMLDSLSTRSYSCNRNELKSRENISGCFKQFYGSSINLSGNSYLLNLKFPNLLFRNYTSKKDILVSPNKNSLQRTGMQKTEKDALKNSLKNNNKPSVNSVTI